jgi:protein-disulfide isomerase
MATIWCATDKNNALDVAMVEQLDPSLEAIMKQGSIDIQEMTKDLKENHEIMQKLNKAIEKGKTSEEKVQIAREFMKEHKAEFDKLDKKAEKPALAAKAAPEKSEKSENCTAIIEEHYKLGQSLQVAATPSLITLNGDKIDGYDKAEKLIAKLANFKK